MLYDLIQQKEIPKLEPMQILVDFAFDDDLQNYMRLVYGNELSDVDSQAKIKKFMTTAKDKLIRDNFEETHIARFCQVKDTNITLVLGYNVFVAGDTMYFVKHAKSGIVKHIEEQKIDHQYICMANLAYDYLELNTAIDTSKICLVIMFTDEDGFKEFEFKPNNEAWGKIEHTYFEARMKSLQEKILSGLEPEQCSDTWNGKRCKIYCDFGPNKLNMCTKADKGEDNESNS